MNIQDELAGVYRLRDEAAAQLWALALPRESQDLRALPRLTDWGAPVRWLSEVERVYAIALRGSAYAACVACRAVIGALMQLLNDLIREHVPLEDLLRESIEENEKKRGAA